MTHSITLAISNPAQLILPVPPSPQALLPLCHWAAQRLIALLRKQTLVSAGRHWYKLNLLLRPTNGTKIKSSKVSNSRQWHWCNCSEAAQGAVTRWEFLCMLQFELVLLFCQVFSQHKQGSCSFSPFALSWNSRGAKLEIQQKEKTRPACRQWRSRRLAEPVLHARSLQQQGDALCFCMAARCRCKGSFRQSHASTEAVLVGTQRNSYAQQRILAETGFFFSFVCRY